MPKDADQQEGGHCGNRTYRNTTQQEGLPDSGQAID
jgi:hypothetical protein